MSAYITDDDLADMALPSAAMTGITSAQKLKAREAASSVADSYLRGNWGVPIANPSAALKDAVAAIAAWRLMVRRGFAPEAPDSNLRTAYEDAIKWLERCQRRECIPFDETDDATPSVGEGQPLMASDYDITEVWG